MCEIYFRCSVSVFWPIKQNCVFAVLGLSRKSEQVVRAITRRFPCMRKVVNARCIVQTNYNQLVIARSAVHSPLSPALVSGLRGSGTVL